MKLIKYCEEKFNYSKSEKIQIGTLDYYRNHDNKFIADPGECIGGPYSIKPNSSPAEISQGFIKQIGGGITFQGAMYDTPVITIESGGVLIINKKLKFPNVYIFCCSYEESPNIKTAKGLGYNSWYEIDDPDQFMKEIQNGFPEVAKLTFKGAVTTDVKHIHGPVNYCSRENQVFENEFNLIKNLLFTKAGISEKDETVSYEKNKEYRFVWLFTNNTTNAVMDVEEDPILVRNSAALKTTLK